jgi:hypothetical protein
MDPAERLDISDIPNDSIVVLSKEESDVPGYVHQKYAFVSQACPGGFQIIDHHGAPIDPNDADLLLFESQQLCSTAIREMNSYRVPPGSTGDVIGLRLSRSSESGLAGNPLPLFLNDLSAWMRSPTSNNCSAGLPTWSTQTNHASRIRFHSTGRK